MPSLALKWKAYRSAIWVGPSGDVEPFADLVRANQQIVAGAGYGGEGRCDKGFGAVPPMGSNPPLTRDNSAAGEHWPVLRFFPRIDMPSQTGHSQPAIL